MSVTIKLRRGNAADWTSQNIVLASGEPGYEINTGRFKIGNGSTAWNSLSYASVVPTGILAGSGIGINFGTNGSTATISASGLNSSYISDFNEAVDDRIGSGLFVSGTGINLNYNDDGNSFTVSVTGLIASPSGNRILTSRDNTTTGIDAESNLTFDGTTLNVTGDVSANYYFGNFDGPIVYDCRNNTASTINKGTPVYISGHFANGKVDIAPADASNSAKMPALGLLGETLTTGQEGHVYVFGALSNVDTQTPGYTVGQTLYVSPTGGLTTTKPTASNHLIQNIGRVARVSDTNGRLLVLGPARTNDIPNSGNFASLTVNSTGVSVIGHTHTSSDITNFNTSVSGLLPTVANSGDNRLLTSTGTTTGLNAESNATFDGTTLAVSGAISVDNLKLDGNTLSSTNSNGNIIISPSGTGALQRDSGGNARGEYAIDWQTVRSSGTMVAGGSHSVIGGGRNNTITQPDSIICGGFSNAINADYGYYSFIGGGSTNTISAANCYYSFIGGGTSNSINYSAVYDNVSLPSCFIGGGDNNNILGGIAGYSAIVGGLGNLIENSNLATVSSYSFIGGGKNNTVSASHSAIIGGQNNTANHSNVFILGSNITATQNNTTYVQNLDVSTTGDIDVLRINKFYHNNLSVASGLSDTDLLVAVINPTGTSSTEVISGSTLRSSLLNQPATLRFRQGTEAERLLITPASGEPIWTTDSQRFYIGDGTTVGGDLIGPIYKSGNGSNSIVTSFSSTSAASGDYSVVGGGNGNVIRSTADGSVIGGGYDNTVWSPKSYIGGGEGNTTGSSFYDYISHHAICGGWKNTISGGYSFSLVGGCFIGGGAYNEVSGDQPYHTIGGGYDNSINSQGYRASTIAGGAYNQIIGDYTGGSAIGGGQNNTIGAGNTGGYFCTIAGGQYNTISDNGSYGNAIGGGRSNNISNNSNHATIPGGYRAKTTRYGELSHAAGYFASQGDAQHTTLIARRETSTATANQVLFLDGSFARLTIPAKTTWTFEVKLSAYNDSDSAGAGWIFRGAIRRNGANGTALIGSIIEENWKDTAMSSTNASVVADDTNEALEIRVTGIASKNIRWVAVVDISQVSYGTP